MKIVSEACGIPPSRISFKDSFRGTLGLDSLEILDMIIDFETEFSMDVPDDISGRFFTVDDVVKYLSIVI